uniref:Transmembrane protein 135 N-terminal domain-containing protein n=1 Tax=Globisporangium ultimum (strain ATCC 200006 / CBS 805.95 / DAOM BR144) TaxID=431595 RepID=K3XAA9_GLOUD
MRNRALLVSLLLLRGTRGSARVAMPSRSLTAVAVFIGVYRFVHRLGLRLQKRGRREVSSTTEESCSRTLAPHDRTASIAASILGVLCIDPRSRSAIISLLSTNTASLMFREYVSKHPELACLKPLAYSQCLIFVGHALYHILELLVFMLSGGWIMYSGFFHPESYETSHLNLIMKYTLVSPQAAHQLQEQYRQGLNPSTCTIRHPGLDCNEYLFPGFMKRVVKLGYRVYFPVHFTAWIISLRHAKVRATPPLEMVTKFFTKLTRSAMYFITFIAVGWTLSCHSSPLGDRSLAWRKFQFLLCGSLPAVSLLWESPARRRPIGVILVSYVLVSVGAVLTRRLRWLKQGSGPVRTAIDVALFTTTVAYTLPTMLQSNRILQRLLLGPNTKSSRKSGASAILHGGDHTDMEKVAK